jgi:hypothetical protein
MDEYEELEKRPREATSLQEATDVLSDLLGGGYAVWDDGSLYSIKQLVARVNGLQIHVYADEHAPPHFHVKSAEVDACFTIQDGEFMKGSIDGRGRKLVLCWFERSRHSLVAAWNATRPSDCPVGQLTCSAQEDAGAAENCGSTGTILNILTLD